MNRDRRPGGSPKLVVHGNGCEGPLQELSQALASELDFEQLGARLVALVSAAELLRHSDARSSVRDYSHPEPGDLEGQFLQDVLCCSTADVVRKWFAGSALRYRELAGELAREAAG